MEHPAVGNQTRLDRFSDRATNFISRWPFLLLCLVLVGVWAWGWAIDEKFVLHHFVGDLIGILTLVLVDFLQNSERRAEHALNKKLDAVAKGLGELMERDSTFSW